MGGGRVQQLTALSGDARGLSPLFRPLASGEAGESEFFGLPFFPSVTSSVEVALAGGLFSGPVAPRRSHRLITPAPPDNQPLSAPPPSPSSSPSSLSMSTALGPKGSSLSKRGAKEEEEAN